MEVFTNYFYEKKKNLILIILAGHIALMNCFQDIRLIISLKTYSLGIKLKGKLVVFLRLDAITRILARFLDLTIA